MITTQEYQFFNSYNKRYSGMLR